jgi:hypothetical protein
MSLNMIPINAVGYGLQEYPTLRRTKRVFRVFEPKMSDAC